MLASTHMARIVVIASCCVSVSNLHIFVMPCTRSQHVTVDLVTHLLCTFGVDTDINYSLLYINLSDMLKIMFFISVLQRESVWLE